MISQLAFTENLILSYQYWTKLPLFMNEIVDWQALDQETLLQHQIQLLQTTQTIVLAHGTELDPILRVGNQAALKLWEMDEQQFLCTPSRKTAEPDNQEKRQELLKQTQKDGFVENYHGIRISSSGRKFRIEKVTIWNVLDLRGKGQLIGQGATFRDWCYVGNSPLR